MTRGQALGLGVVGAGSVSLKGILPHLTQADLADRARVVAVCDPVEGRAAAAARRFSVECAYETLDALLADPAVDAITIASPIGVHYEQGRRALLAGKHVHFNKTMTVTTAEADDLIDLAADRDLRIVASPGEMLRPYNQRIKTMIAEGRIGRVCWAICGAAFETYHESEAVRGGDDILSTVDPSWYFSKPGGGPLYDMTVYALHALTGILGPVRRVTGLSGIRIPERSFHGQIVRGDADDNTVVLLDFGEGLFAVAYGTAAGSLTSWDDWSGRYFGTEGRIDGLLLDGEPFEFPGCELARSHPDGGTRPGRGGNEWLLPHVTGVHRDIDEQHVFEDIMQLVDWVRDDIASPVTAEHARHVIDIIEAAYRAAATGAAQPLSTSF